MRNKKKTKISKKVWMGSLVLLICIVTFASISENDFAAVPHRNLVDTKISQYSDKNITRNAVAANSEFKNLTFESQRPESSFFSNQLAAVTKAIKSFVAFSSKKDGAKEYGTWVWTPTMQLTPDYMDSIILGAKADGINTIYLSIDSYLDIFVMSKGAERERNKKLFENKLENFIIRANNQGIAVDAEAGWQNWAEEGHTYKALAIVNFVRSFNENRSSGKFRGFQYDVEPYLLESYQKNPEIVLQNFLKLIDGTERFLAQSDLRFSVVVPDFWDGKDELTPNFSYNNKKDYVFGHLLNILDRRDDSSIIIMSYRNYALGEDGAIEITQNEMHTAKSGGYKTRVIVAQETGDVPPPYITFHNMPKKYFYHEVGKINTAFASHPNFGGIAVHYANAFMTLK